MLFLLDGPIFAIVHIAYVHEEGTVTLLCQRKASCNCLLGLVLLLVNLMFMSTAALQDVLPGCTGACGKQPGCSVSGTVLSERYGAIQGLEFDRSDFAWSCGQSLRHQVC